MKRLLTAATVFILGVAVLMSSLVVVVSLSAASSVATTTTGGFSPHWRDDFNGSALSPDWTKFNGPGNEFGPRSARNITVHDGVADLAVAPAGAGPTKFASWDGWAGASMCACTASVSLYGRYQARVQMTAGAGWRATVLTWPKTGHWPPEIDFMEAESPSRNMMTTHWYDTTRPRNNGMTRPSPATVATDFTTWRTVGVDWTPTVVTFTLDGVPVGTTAHSPGVPMWLGLTAAMHGHGVHPSSPQHLTVDWVSLDTWTAGATGCVSGPGAPGAAQAAQAAGFPADQLVTAVAVAGAESGYDPTATNLNTNGTTDYGLWQINSVHADLLAGGDWRDPAANARMAYSVWQAAGSSWTPWTTFNTGAYQSHLAEAQAAVAGLSGAGGCTGGATGAAAVAVAFAMAQIGKPYQWGAHGPNGDCVLHGGTLPDYDCSCLTQAAWSAAGVTIPRVTRDQYAALPRVPLAVAAPGDLVYFATNTADPGTIHHVGLVLGGGKMVNAPYTGTFVRIDTYAGASDVMPFVSRP